MNILDLSYVRFHDPSNAPYVTSQMGFEESSQDTDSTPSEVAAVPEKKRKRWSLKRRNLENGRERMSSLSYGYKLLLEKKSTGLAPMTEKRLSVMIGVRARGVRAVTAPSVFPSDIVRPTMNSEAPREAEVRTPLAGFQNYLLVNSIFFFAYNE